MLATSEHFQYYFKTSLLFCFLFIILPIVQPLSFNIPNFNDTESANLIGTAGVAKIENGTIVLNPLIENGVGRAIYGQPLHLKNSSNGNVTDFSTRFSFTIGVPTQTNYGDGFAFYVAPLLFQIPQKSESDGSTLGLYGDTQNNIVAVEFDTYVNDDDPPVQHVGINNNSVASLNYSRFDIESNIGKMGHALITHNASAKLLSVSWFFEGTSSGFTPNANSLSYHIDLGETLPEWVNVGFSGATGSSSEQNVIHSWEFASTLNSTSLEVNKENTDMIVKYKFHVKLVVVAVTCSIFLVLLIIGVSLLIFIKKTRREDGSDLDKASMPRRFGYNELVAATNGFADDRRLGEGGYGEVYKGRTLTWGVRYKIALGVVRALRYLHEDAEQCVLHRDIKSANVLLDTDFNTKVSDFGMAKLVDPRLRTQKTKVVGTYGYLAPEYVKEGRASKESDMYGFGVLALEIACGKRTYEDREHNHVPLTNWVWKHYVEGNILNAADKGLKGDYDVNEMTCLLTVGIWCSHPDHKKRPKAEQVINALKQETPLPLLSM
ncbi:L-type lectin-domain containing receptor kinase V.9 [Glycine soja]